MQHRKTLSRLMVTTLAAGSIAVPVASAAPVGPVGPVHDMHASTVHKPKPVYQDLRTENAVDSSRAPAQRFAGPPTWPTNPQPISPAPAPVADSGGDGGIDVSTSLAIAGALALCGMGAAALRIRSTRTAH